MTIEIARHWRAISIVMVFLLSEIMDYCVLRTAYCVLVVQFMV